jgi:colicin import membrane protein
MTDTRTCIFPGCDRPAVPAHAMGGPQPAFCDDEGHNALRAHQERVRRERETPPGTPTNPSPQGA